MLSKESIKEIKPYALHIQELFKVYYTTTKGLSENSISLIGLLLVLYTPLNEILILNSQKLQDWVVALSHGFIIILMRGLPK